MISPPFDPYAEEILEHFGAKSGVGVEEGIDPTTKTGREILVIETYTLFTSSYVTHAPGGTLGSQPYVLLHGQPSPSSTVTHGYIMFVPTGDLRAPSFDPSRKLIRLTVDIAAMPLTLQQLTHAKRYLWMGHFDGGHIYGDLHSTP